MTVIGQTTLRTCISGSSSCRIERVRLAFGRKRAGGLLRCAQLYAPTQNKNNKKPKRI